MNLERCFICDSATGRAGAGDDSIYDDDGVGPFCLDCWNKHKPPSSSEQPLVDGDLATQRAIHDGCKEKVQPTPRTAYFDALFETTTNDDLDALWNVIDAVLESHGQLERELAAAQSASGALHASAPEGHKCSDCTMDSEPCPQCYEAWWRKRHPNVVFTLSSTNNREEK